MHRRKSLVFLIFFGFIAFGNVARNPRFETYRTVDVLSLVVAGMCFGIGLTSLLTVFRSKAWRD